VLAAGVTLGGLWIASAVEPGIAFPPAAVAEALVRGVPGDVATFFIERLGRWAMRLLTLGAVAGALAAAAAALTATAEEERPRPYRAGALLALMSGFAALAGPAGGLGLVATGLALVIAAWVFGLTAGHLLDLMTREPAQDDGRRRALRVAILGAAGLALGGGAVGWLARRFGGPDTNIALAPADVRARVPRRAPFPQVDGITREITTVADHYVVDINLVRPIVEADGWSLDVRGEVERPLQFTLADLQRDFEVVEEYAVLTCVSNEVGGELVGHSLWGGVRLADVLARVAPRRSAVDLALRAADGYSDSIPIELALDPSVVIAFAQNRRPLTQEHGFPCRLRVPAIYGMKNVKWLESIEVVGHDYEGYWQRRGWSDDATVRTQSRIDAAASAQTARRGVPTWIAGVAWAGARGIERVEVSTDDGATWAPAELRAPIGPLSWRQWAYRWIPECTGPAVIVSRATDGNGEVQTARGAPPHPAGATGYHSVTVEVQ
jgi:DMSO/TMAO reductase YedYZ molybdopterin-dependent catalytic subunit